MAGPRHALTLRSKGQRSNPNANLGLQLALKGKGLDRLASVLLEPVSCFSALT